MSALCPLFLKELTLTLPIFIIGRFTNYGWWRSTSDIIDFVSCFNDTPTWLPWYECEHVMVCIYTWVTKLDILLVYSPILRVRLVRKSLVKPPDVKDSLRRRQYKLGCWNSHFSLIERPKLISLTCWTNYLWRELRRISSDVLSIIGLVQLSLFV